MAAPSPSPPPRTPHPVWTALGTLVAVALLALGAIATVVALGLYDVSAVQPHTRPVHALLEVGLKQSVRRQAGDEPPPVPLDDPHQLALGAACFRTHCVACHGAPGQAAQPFAQGMQPVPDSLSGAARRWQPRELYWITRHGIKMTGMPAWEYRLSDEELWAVAGFIVQLGSLSPAQYRALDQAPTLPRCTGQPEAATDLPLDRRALARRALLQHGCTACHAVPGLPSNAAVGPPLTGLAGRERLGSRLPMTADHLALWIRDPQAVEAHSAMPAQGVSEAQARLMAEYLLQP